MESRPLVLPDHRDISPHILGFVDDHFITYQHLCKSPILEAELKTDFADSATDLTNLQKNLTKLVVSWISHSITSKNVLHQLNLKLQNLCLFASQYGIGFMMIGKILGEFPQLVKEVSRVETLRNYAETTLQLEGLVGDLEDAVFVNRSMFSANFLKPSNSSAKQGRLLQAVNGMNDIEDVIIKNVKGQPRWCQLVKSVDIRLDEIFAVLRPQVFADYRSLNASLGWPPQVFTSKTECDQISELPNPLVLMPPGKREIYSQSFLALCALQHLQSRRENRKHNVVVEHKEYQHRGLWAIDELVSSIASQTEYHFLKWAIDQPEFIFALVYRITRDFVIGVDDVLQPLIDSARLGSYSAKEAWVFAMVQMLAGFLKNKVFSVFAERYKEKHLKAEATSSWLHLIDLIVSFDIRMQSLLKSEPGSLGGFSRGVSALSALNDRPDWLTIWAKMELRDAWKKLKAELKDEKAWFVSEFYIVRESDQYLLSTKEDHKTPLIAESAVKRAWEMIERCRTLPNILMRVQFIRSSTGRFFWYFFNVLLLHCKRPEFPSGEPNDDALMRICVSINSARYIESKLQEWSNEVNFLEMRIAEIDSSIHGVGSFDENTYFFSEEIKSLAELETNWVMDIITGVISQFEILSREYFRDRESFEQVRKLDMVTVLANTNLAVSSDLIEALDFLRSQLQDIKMFLNPVDFMDLWRSAADAIDHFILCSILESNIRFSDKVANQFGTDMKALFLVFQPFCTRPEAFFPCLRDSLMLLKLAKEEVRHLLVDSSNNIRRKVFPYCKYPHLDFHQVEQILGMRKFGI